MNLNTDINDVNLEKSHEKEPKKEKSTRDRIYEYFKEYCNHTSIHGFHYLAESRSYIERLLWLALISCSISASIYLIIQTYNKFQLSPVIVSFATRESPIYTIPFPAVTICPETKARKDLFDFTNVIHRLRKNKNITEQEKRYAKYMSYMCQTDSEFFNKEVYFDEDFYVALDELKIPVDYMMDSCAYINIKNKCQEWFVPIVTDVGICYTFNILDRTQIFNNDVIHYSNFQQIVRPEFDNGDWNIDSGYGKLNNPAAYPMRAFLAGADNALVITFFQNKSNSDYLCLRDVQGFSVFLHAPFSIPLFRKQYFSVGLGRSVLSYVQPKVMSTSKKVMHFSPTVRECYFSTEKKLKYFKIYSPRNCKMECYTNYTLKECGCVNYFMPRENGTKICGNAKVECMSKAEMNLKMEQLSDQIEEANEDFYCNCKPLCSDLTYDVEVASTPWEYQEQFKAQEMEKNWDNESIYSKLTIFFKSDSFLTYERNELYGPTDLLANFGGLLGLFTGFSLLSAAEILYFLSIRMCCNVRLFRRWTGED